MKDAEIIKVLETEMECVKRQDGPTCPRFVGMTCRACDLVMDTSKVLEAYQGAIDALNTVTEEKVKAEAARQDAEDATREEWEESRYLDEREKTIKGRWGL